MKKHAVIALMSGLLFVSNGFACGVRGTAVWASGSKIDGTATISTTWNSKKAFPRDGRYELDLGSDVCGQKITVYMDGNDGKEVRVDGWVTVNFVRR